MDFKERVKNESIEYAAKYKEYFVEYDYILVSEAFENKYQNASQCAAQKHYLTNLRHKPKVFF